MNFFISYKYTGIPLDKLHMDIDSIMKIVKNYGNSYCNLYDDDHYKSNNFTTKEIMQHALNKLNESNYLIIYVDGEIGEGMAIECGYACKMEIPCLLLIKNGVKSISLKAVVNNVIEYDDHSDMLVKLEDFLRYSL